MYLYVYSTANDDVIISLFFFFRLINNNNNDDDADGIFSYNTLFYIFVVFILLSYNFVEGPC